MHFDQEHFTDCPVRFHGLGTEASFNGISVRFSYPYVSVEVSEEFSHLPQGHFFCKAEGRGLLGIFIAQVESVRSSAGRLVLDCEILSNIRYATKLVKELESKGVTVEREGHKFPAQIEDVSATRATLRTELPLSSGQRIRICLEEGGAAVDCTVGSSRVSTRTPGCYHARVSFAKADGFHFGMWKESITAA